MIDKEFILIMLSSVFISSVSQIILKKSAKKFYSTKMAEYLNPYVVIAYAIFFISTFLTIYALKYIPLSLAPIIEATGYIFVLVLGKIFLDEKIGRTKLMGIFLILIGVVIFSF